MGGQRRLTGEGERLAVLEARVTALEAAAGRRKDRTWGLALAVLSGLALPAVVLLIGVLIHRATG